MLYALSWFFVITLLALWSLAGWALHGMAVWTTSNAGALVGTATGVGGLALPDWIAPWIPTELVQVTTQLMAGLGPVVDNLLQAAPTLAGGLTAATWVFWAIGSVLLLLLGAGLHLLIALWRRKGRNGDGSGPNAGRSRAAG